MATIIHYPDSFGIKFIHQNGCYKVGSRCGCLRAKKNVTKKFVDANYSEDPLKVTCSMCSRAIRNLIDNSKIKEMEISTFNSGDQVLFMPESPYSQRMKYDKLQFYLIEHVLFHPQRKNKTAYRIINPITNEFITNASGFQLRRYQAEIEIKPQKKAPIHFIDNDRTSDIQIVSTCGAGYCMRFIDETKTLNPEANQRFTTNPKEVTCLNCRNKIVGLLNNIDHTPYHQKPHDKERDILMAKEISLHVNTFFKTNIEFSLGYFRIRMGEVRCKYYSQVVVHLRKNNLIRYKTVGTDKSGKKNMNLFEKTKSEPIHFTVFLEVIRHRRNTYGEQIPLKTMNENQSQPSIKHALDFIENQRIQVKEVTKPVSNFENCGTIKSWIEICDQIEISDKKLNEFINMTEPSIRHLDSLREFVFEWNKSKKALEGFDNFLGSDQNLVNELRKRGYVVTASKIIEL